MPRREKGPIDAIVARIRKRAPKTKGIAVTLADGEIKTLELEDHRGRWDRVRRFLEANDWQRLECYSSTNCKTGYLDAEKNPEWDDDGGEEETAPELINPYKAAENMFSVCARHVEKVLEHVNKTSGEAEKQRMEFTNTLLARNQQLEAHIGEAYELTREAQVILAQRGQEGGLDQKEQALLMALDGFGRKLGLPPMGIIEAGQRKNLPAARTEAEAAADREPI